MNDADSSNLMLPQTLLDAHFGTSAPHRLDVRPACEELAMRKVCWTSSHFQETAALAHVIVHFHCHTARYHDSNVDPMLWTTDWRPVSTQVPLSR